MIGTGPEVPPETALKDLEKLVEGMEVWAVRAGVAAYQEGSWTPEDGRYTGKAIEEPPEPAPAPSPEHIPQGEGEGRGEGYGEGEGFALPQDGSRLSGSEIRGRMTVQEVVDYCQVPLETLIAELGLPNDVDSGLWMRDLANQYGIEVTTIREVVEQYQAEH
jgi:hypothetical protein